MNIFIKSKPFYLSVHEWIEIITFQDFLFKHGDTVPRIKYHIHEEITIQEFICGDHIVDCYNIFKRIFEFHQKSRTFNSLILKNKKSLHTLDNLYIIESNMSNIGISISSDILSLLEKIRTIDVTKMSMTWVHGDLHKRNILHSNNKIYLIDFDDMFFGFSIYDYSFYIISEIFLNFDEEHIEIVSDKVPVLKYKLNKMIEILEHTNFLNLYEKKNLLIFLEYTFLKLIFNFKNIPYGDGSIQNLREAIEIYNSYREVFF